MPTNKISLVEIQLQRNPRNHGVKNMFFTLETKLVNIF
jgi:hypothetical protein